VWPVTALGRRWHRFDLEYRLPGDLPASVKARDGRLLYTARASVTIARAVACSASVECWSPDVHFAVEGFSTNITSHSAHPAGHYAHSLSAAPHLARLMLSCCPVIECTLPASPHCSVSRLQLQGRPVAKATQDYRLEPPSPPTPRQRVPRYTKNANFMAPHP